MAGARWSGAALLVVAGVILGLAIAAVLVTATWGGVATPVACSDEQTNPASLCRNGWYAHGFPGLFFLGVGLVLATGIGICGGVLLHPASGAGRQG